MSNSAGNEKLNISYATNIVDGDELRNINCFEYLKKIAERIPNDSSLEPLKSLKNIFTNNPHYKETIPYGDLYTQFILYFEANISAIEAEGEKVRNEFKLREARIENFEANVSTCQSKLKMLTEEIKKINLIKNKSNEDKERLLELHRIYRQINFEYQTNKNGLKFETNKLPLLKQQLEKADAIDEIIDLVYANPNQALERSAAMVQQVVDQTKHTSSKIESNVRERMLGRNGKIVSNYFKYLIGRSLNKTTPQEEGSRVGRFLSMGFIPLEISFDSKNFEISLKPQSSIKRRSFKPQSTTSMSSVRNYNYKSPDDPVEYRFGTQGQYHNGDARVSPSFETWLRVQKRKREKYNREHPEQAKKSQITHIYFNNLGRDRTDMEGKRESRLTRSLEALEQEHDNVAVITMPSDKGLMDHHLLEKHEKFISYDRAFTGMFKVAVGTSEMPIQDFFISDRTKALLYGEGNPYDKEAEEEVIKYLLNKSFEKLGFNKNQQLSPAELQAVYFHFIKYELANFIIGKLQPDSYNMSCKDAIDRGGVSSAYYNLIKSIESGEPLNKEEFDRALHAAPTLVKGRGMNHHAKLIWNAVDRYVHGQPEMAPPWLVEWRNKHAPSHTIEKYIQKLDAYIERKLHENVQPGLFSKPDSKNNELTAAINLRAILKSNANTDDITFTSEQWKALERGELKKIRTAIETHHAIDLELFKPNKIEKSNVVSRVQL